MDIKQLVVEHKECMEDSKLFISYINDLCHDMQYDKKLIKVMSVIIDEKLTDNIKNWKYGYTDENIEQICEIIYSKYGYARKFTRNAVLEWLKVFDIEIIYKANEDKKENTIPLVKKEEKAETISSENMPVSFDKEKTVDDAITTNYINNNTANTVTENKNANKNYPKSKVYRFGFVDVIIISILFLLAVFVYKWIPNLVGFIFKNVKIHWTPRFFVAFAFVMTAYITRRFKTNFLSVISLIALNTAEVILFKTRSFNANIDKMTYIFMLILLIFYNIYRAFAKIKNKNYSNDDAVVSCVGSFAMGLTLTSCSSMAYYGKFFSIIALICNIIVGIFAVYMDYEDCTDDNVWNKIPSRNKKARKIMLIFLMIYAIAINVIWFLRYW